MTKKFSFQIILNIFIKMGAVAVGILTARWATNYLSTSELAEYNSIIAYTSILLTALHFGLPEIIQKVYTNTTNDSVRRQAWTTMLIMRGISYLIGLVLVFLTYQLSGSKNIALVTSFFTVQFILVLDGHYRSVCDAEGRTWQFSIADFVAKAIAITSLYLGIFVFNIQSSVWFLLTCLTGGYLLSLLVDVIWQYKYTKLAKPNFQIFKGHFHSIFLLTLSNIAFALYNTTDKLFIRWFDIGNADFNGYVNGYKIFESVLIIPGVTIPMLASYMKKQYDKNEVNWLGGWFQSNFQFLSKTQSFFAQWITVSAGLGLFLSVAVIIGGPILLFLIDPQNLYPQAYTVLPWLAAAAFLNPIVVIMARFIVFSNGGEKYELMSSLVLMIIAITGYVIFIPKFGIVGAAMATFFALIVDVFLKMFFLRKVISKI